MILYIRFCLTHGLDYFNPSVFTISLFAQYLANFFKAPATWRNYISGAKTWLQAQGGESAAFTSAAFQAVVRGATRSSNHVPHQAPPISPGDVKIICDYLDDQGKSGVVIRSAILLSYFTFLRQSNVLTTSAEPWGGAHTLSRSDVVLGREGAYVTVRSSKTTSRQEPPRILFIPKMSSSRYCLLQAYALNVLTVPAPSHAAAFTLPCSVPLTAQATLGAVRSAMRAAGHNNPGGLTLHGLRRGAALASVATGATLEDIRATGLWRSDAVYNYVPRSVFSSAPSALATTLGQ